MPTWGLSVSCFFVQDRLVKKGDDGRELLNSSEESRKQSNEAITALKLATKRVILPKAVYSSYISRFPMLPVSYTEIDENKDISYSAGPPITTGEERAIRSIFGLINQVETGDKEVPQYFISAL